MSQSSTYRLTTAGKFWVSVGALYAIAAALVFENSSNASKNLPTSSIENSAPVERHVVPNKPAPQILVP